MRAAVDGLATFLLIGFACWSVAFGWTAASLARRAGRSPMLGLALGIVLGPLAWVILEGLARRGHDAPVRITAEVPHRPPSSYGEHGSGAR